MASKQVPLLDEAEWNVPQALDDLPERDIDHQNNFSWYFYSSIFNETASNNTAVLSAHVNDPQTYNVIHDRKDFHQRVQGVRAGLNFMVAGEPQGPGQPWLMQRQNKLENGETLVEGNWYNQGTVIRQAPSLLDVVRSRLLTVSTRLQQVEELSRNMTHWTPATGYSYYPPTFEAPKAVGSRAGSRAGSPTLAPMDIDASQTTAAATAVDTAEGEEDDFSDALFMQSLVMTNRYGDEYMDENPLKGEPGAFVFTNSKEAVNERKKAQEQSAQVAIAPKSSQPPSVAPSIAPTPKGGATPAPIDTHSRKSSVAPTKEKKKKKERRESKGPASPTTPGPGVPPTA